MPPLDLEPPVIVAWGAGVDSTAMLIEMVARGERIDMVLFADTGAEKPAKPAEIRALPRTLLRQIVLIEARAQPRLRTVEGLWRKSVQGRRGAEARPGSMTVFIRTERLLPAEEVDAIVAQAPASLVRWQDAVAEGVSNAALRPEAARWLTVFDAFADAPDRIDGAPGLYAGLRRAA